MNRVDFYHLQKQTLDEVLPKLLQKAYASGHHVLVKVGTAERVEFINNALWTFSDESFLPHGSRKDGQADNQPIWLTSENDNANNASYLFLVDGAEVDVKTAEKYERLFNVFDGNAQNLLEQARNLWKIFKDAGFEVHYWQQNIQGTWENRV